MGSGCNGGLMDYAFQFYESTSVASESSYAYTGRDGTCKSSYTAAIPEGGVTGFKDISNEADLLDAVANTGPISVAIEADQMSFQLYSGGVLTGSCGTNLDHGVLAVGFGSDSGTDYWKVKNSWGASWGANGYILIERGVNKCGIADGPPSYPTVNGGSLSAESDEWEAYKQEFGKVYNGDEEQRKANFMANKKMWGEHESGAVLGATQFSDMTLEEFQALPIRGYSTSMKTDLPNLGEHAGEAWTGSTIDWTTRGAVTAVKDQGQCGSCWAFSTTGGLEGAWEIASGNLVSMSEQQFVDCSKQNSGCNGGLMESAFSWAKSQNIATESSYAYKGLTPGSPKGTHVTTPEGFTTWALPIMLWLLFISYIFLDRCLCICQYV